MYMQRYLLMLCFIVILLTITVFSQEKVSEASSEPAATPTLGNPVIESRRSEITPIASSTTVPAEVNDKYVFVTAWGSKGNGDGQFNEPSDIAVDLNGNVYVADTENTHIQKFDSQGKFISKFGSKGNGYGQFNFPIGIAVDSKDNIYVLDFNFITELNSNGSLIKKWYAYDRGVGLQLAQDFDVGASDYIYLVEMERYRIEGVEIEGVEEEFIKDKIQVLNSEGKFIKRWLFYRSGINFSPGIKPVCDKMVIDKENNIFVIEHSNINVHVTWLAKYALPDKKNYIDLIFPSIGT